ncbi:MAG: phosphate uptake regulator PhoU [archaeon]
MISTDIRKIQKTGASTFTISLPKSWITKNNVNSGDKLSIFEDKNGSLNINIHTSEKVLSEREIDIDRYDDCALTRKLLALYLDGSDRIKLVSKRGFDSSKREAILKHIKRTIGFEISDESKNTMILQDFFSNDYLSFMKSIRRAFIISKFMLNDAMKTDKQNQKALESIMKWEEEIDRILFLVKRQTGLAIINSLTLKQLNINALECMSYKYLIEQIEAITDHIVAIAQQNVYSRDMIPDEVFSDIHEFYEMTLEYYENAMKCYLKKDFYGANSLVDKKDEFLEKKNSINVKELEKEAIIPVNTIVSNIASVASHAFNIAEEAVNRTE